MTYANSICTGLRKAQHVPFRKVVIGDWEPKIADCHANVDRWVQAHPGTTVVRGWVTYYGTGHSTVLTHHSVVRDLDGQLFDITPLYDEQHREDERANLRFVPHIGDGQLFFTTKDQYRELECPTEAEQPATQEEAVSADYVKMVAVAVLIGLVLLAIVAVTTGPTSLERPARRFRLI